MSLAISPESFYHTKSTLSCIWRLTALHSNKRRGTIELWLILVKTYEFCQLVDALGHFVDIFHLDLVSAADNFIFSSPLTLEYLLVARHFSLGLYYKHIRIILRDVCTLMCHSFRPYLESSVILTE